MLIIAKKILKLQLINSNSVRKFLDFKSYSKLIFISSDAVFSSELGMAREKTTSPENIYGLSKLNGEFHKIQNKIILL